MSVLDQRIAGYLTPPYPYRKPRSSGAFPP
jgi:hypothetical protein